MNHDQKAFTASASNFIFWAIIAYLAFDILTGAGRIAERHRIEAALESQGVVLTERAR